MHDSVTLRMAADPLAVWELVSDVRNTGRWSPETFEAEWLGGASGPAVGAKFRGHVRRNGRGPVYWTTCKVVSCEPGREFAFVVIIRGEELNTWRYEFRPVDGGVEVTESFELKPTWWLRLYWAMLGWARGRTNRDGMRETLERIKVAAEQPAIG